MRADRFFEILQVERPELAAEIAKNQSAYILALNLIRLRKKHQWTLVHLAQATKMSVTTLSDLETGVANPKLRQLQKVADAFGISVARLLTDEAVSDTVQPHQEQEELPLQSSSIAAIATRSSATSTTCVCATA